MTGSAKICVERERLLYACSAYQHVWKSGSWAFSVSLAATSFFYQDLSRMNEDSEEETCRHHILLVRGILGVYLINRGVSRQKF